MRIDGSQLGCGGFPFGSDGLEALPEIEKLAAELLRAARQGVGFGLLEFGDKFGLEGLELLNLGFEALNEFLALFALTRAGLALLGFEALLVFAGGRGRLSSDWRVGWRGAWCVLRVACCVLRVT